MPAPTLVRRSTFLKSTARSTARALLVFAIAGACAAIAYAQRTTQSEPAPTGFRASASDIAFNHLNVNNGLANPVAQAFAEDGDGFLWVGSQSGLQRWDGYRFWNYKQVLGSATSLPDNLVQVLYTDWQGRLWLGTSSGGLAMYDRREDRFVQYHLSANNISGADVFAITGDGGRGLWVGSDAGLDHLDTDSGKFTHVALAANGGRQPQHASALLRGADGMLWVGTDQGLQRSLQPNPGDPPKTLFQAVPLPVSKDGTSSVLVLFCDRTGRVWIGTPHGVYVIEHPGGILAGVAGTTSLGLAQPVVAGGADGAKLASQHYLAIAETNDGEIWLGTQDEGILAIETNGAAGWQARRIGHDGGIPTSLSDDMVYALYLGKPGIMWAGTRRGISFIDTTPKSAVTMLGGASPNSEIRDTNVYSVLGRKDGSVWLALGHEGIDILDASGHRTGQLLTGPAHPETTLPPGSLNGLVETGDGSIFITTQQGLYRATPTGKTDIGKDGGKQTAPLVERVAIGPEASTNLARVLPDNGKLWIGGSNGLWVFDGKGPATRPEMHGPLTDQRVTVLMRDRGASLWIGTQNGLSRLDLATHAVEAILPDAADPSALGAGFVSSLLTDRKGRLWVGTFSGGIDVLEGRDAKGQPRFHRIIDGLPNENIDMLVEARDGKIWASTDGGLAVIDPDSFEIRVLRGEDGASLPAYWNGSGAMTSQGDLIFGGIGGVTVVRPGKVKPWDYQPPVMVTNARIGNGSVPVVRFNNGLLEYPVWVGADDNNLTVEFAALDYTAPERNRYEYKLDGFDKDWIPADATRRLARYTNLPPGNYLLEMRGSNRDGVWAPPLKVRIKVLPAWFQTWWFKVLVVLLSLLLLCLFFLLATAYLRRQQHELERQVALRTAELQQMTVELKASQQKLEHMAYTDALTALPNRRMFTEHFKRLLALKRRQEGSFSLLLMDFDDFKEINDTFGHDAGDAVLIEMARRLSALVRESDCLARLGGDEFGLLLGQSHDVEGTEMVCHKIIESFVTPVVFDGQELRTAPSIGIAIYPFDGESQDRLYKAADLALYHAKRRGGNRCSWSDQVSATAAEVR